MSLKLPFIDKRISVRIKFISDRDKGIIGPKHNSVVLISYNGIGDYLYATPAIQAFRKRYPKTKFILAVSRSYDMWNNPLVYDFAIRNPNFDEVRYFEGFDQNNDWSQYNWEDAKKGFNPESTLFLRFNFEDDLDRKIHRVNDCFNLFGIKYAHLTAPKPCLFLTKKDYNKAQEVWQDINPLKQATIFLHIDTRSTDYHYPYTDELIAGLVKRGKKVIIIGSNREYANATTLLIKDHSIFEVSALLEIAKQHAEMISVNSVFHALSPAVGIKNLGFYIFDSSCNCFHYDNMYWVTTCRKEAEFIPQDHIKRISHENVYWDKQGLCTFKPEDILESYDDFFGDK